MFLVEALINNLFIQILCMRTCERAQYPCLCVHERANDPFIKHLFLLKYAPKYIYFHLFK